MNARNTVAGLGLGLALAGPLFASDVGYIYGRVATTDGDAYEGQLRWGTEESFWDDLFNADKDGNEHLAYVDREVLQHIRERHFFGLVDPSLTHLFAIRFGDLKRIEVQNGGNLVVEFRNGERLRLKGGSNDVGAQITVVDPRLGKRELKWNRIRTIEFKDTPSKLEGKLGEPIYGTVKSGPYEFTGRIQWDNDETLTSDKLDGETPNSKIAVPFGNIVAIHKHRSGALVTLKSGNELYLRGTNDVNGDNRGVVVIVPGLGSVRIGWDDFDGASFRPAPGSGRGYAEYAKASHLNGTVVTRNGRHDGRIIFDLDESRDFELLQGRNHDTEYLIPFRDIARIRREGLYRSIVELRMGLSIELEKGQDITRKNDGLLVFEGDREPKYVDWREVTEIVFRSPSAKD